MDSLTNVELMIHGYQNIVVFSKKCRRQPYDKIQLLFNENSLFTWIQQKTSWFELLYKNYMCSVLLISNMKGWIWHQLIHNCGMMVLLIPHRWSWSFRLKYVVVCAPPLESPFRCPSPVKAALLLLAIVVAHIWINFGLHATGRRDAQWDCIRKKDDQNPWGRGHKIRSTWCLYLSTLKSSTFFWGACEKIIDQPQRKNHRADPQLQDQLLRVYHYGYLGPLVHNVWT